MAGFGRTKPLGRGEKNRGIGDPGSETGTERYVHRGGLPAWAGRLLGTYFSVPFSPAAIGRLVFCVICETNLGNGFVFANLCGECDILPP
jgi:hypothetical protein